MSLVIKKIVEGYVDLESGEAGSGFVVGQGDREMFISVPEPELMKVANFWSGNVPEQLPQPAPKSDTFVQKPVPDPEPEPRDDLVHQAHSFTLSTGEEAEYEPLEPGEEYEDELTGTDSI